MVVSSKIKSMYRTALRYSGSDKYGDYGYSGTYKNKICRMLDDKNEILKCAKEKYEHIGPTLKQEGQRKVYARSDIIEVCNSSEFCKRKDKYGKKKKINNTCAIFKVCPEEGTTIQDMIDDYKEFYKELSAAIFGLGKKKVSTQKRSTNKNLRVEKQNKLKDELIELVKSYEQKSEQKSNNQGGGGIKKTKIIKYIRKNKFKSYKKKFKKYTKKNNKKGGAASNTTPESGAASAPAAAESAPAAESGAAPESAPAAAESGGESELVLGCKTDIQTPGPSGDKTLKEIDDFTISGEPWNFEKDWKDGYLIYVFPYENVIDYGKEIDPNNYSIVEEWVQTNRIKPFIDKFKDHPEKLDILKQYHKKLKKFCDLNYRVVAPKDLTLKVHYFALSKYVKNRKYLNKNIRQTGVTKYNVVKTKEEFNKIK